MRIDQSASEHADVRKDSLRGWSVVFAAFVGLLISLGTLMIYSFGVLSAAMGGELGWGALQRGTLFTSASLAGALGGPLWGIIADRVGGRIVALVSSALLAVAFLAIAMVPANLYAMHAAFMIVGLVGAGTMPPTYASVIVGWFNRRRGLALGVTMTSVGVGAAVLPPLAATLIAAYGWRGTYALFGLAIVMVVLPVGFWLLRENGKVRPARDVGPAIGNSRGHLVRSALRERKTLILLAFALLTGAALVQSVSSFVAVLQARGLTLAAAARYQSVLGVSLIGGRILIGGLIDRVFAPFVMCGVLLATAASFFLFMSANTSLEYVLVAAGIGLAIGAEVDFLGFMVSRYFERATFTTIFAFLFASYALGGSLAPALFGWMAQASGSYGAGLAMSGALMLVVAALMLALPRYAPSSEAQHRR